jgi:MFS family permease
MSPDDESELPDVPATESASPRALPRTVIALGWVSLLTDVATEMIFPLLPLFIDQTLRAGKLGVGIVEGMAESISAFLRLPSGIWSDRLGRRKPLLLAEYGIAGLARPLMGLVTAPWQALLIRCTDRFGKGLRGAPRDALIAEITPRHSRGRAFGFHRAMDHAGASIGPLIGFTFLALWPQDLSDPLRTLFLLAFVPGIAVLAVLVFGVREEREEAKPRHSHSEPVGDNTGAPVSFQWSLRAFDSRFRWLLLALAIFTLGNSSDAFLLLRAEELGIPVAYLPLLWSGFHVAKSAANFLLGRWADRFDPRLLLMTGYLIYTAIYLGFGFASSWGEVLVLFLLYSLFYGLSEPSEKLLVSRLVPRKLRGTAFGWHHLGSGVMALPASVLFGLIWKVSPWGAAGAFTLGAVLALLATIVLAVGVRDGRKGTS